MDSKFRLTIFTPTYNRAHTLPKLYSSIIGQKNLTHVEWLLIDDCSTDETAQLVAPWLNEGKVSINYVRLTKNGGKPRAINLATELARSPYLFIVDSDDYLADGIISFILPELKAIDSIEGINGLGFLQQHSDGSIEAKPTFTNYIEATNLQRPQIGLNVDCNEVYKISVLRKYPFQVWNNEIFTPESTVLNAMALDGYKIRWYNHVGVISTYMTDGMTRGSWQLQKRNPMGYAMLFNSCLSYQTGLKNRFKTAAYLTAQSLLGKHPEYLFKSKAIGLTLFSFPLGVAIYLRRLWQYRLV